MLIQRSPFYVISLPYIVIDTIAVAKANPHFPAKNAQKKSAAIIDMIVANFFC